MKRDMDLTRDLLLFIEANPKMDGSREFYFNETESMGFNEYSIDEISYHLALLVEAGFVDGAATSAVPCTIRRLTWEGHEFLDNIKNDDIWSKTKERISGLKSTALSVVAAIAESEIKKRLGLK